MVHIEATRTKYKNGIIIIKPNKPFGVCKYCFKVTKGGNVLHCVSEYGLKNVDGKKCLIRCRVSDGKHA